MARGDPRGQAGLAEFAETDRQVIPSAPDRVRAVGQFDVDAQLWMPRHESFTSGTMKRAVGHRGGHAQQSGGGTVQVADGEKGIVALFDQALAAREKV